MIPLNMIQEAGPGASADDLLFSSTPNMLAYNIMSDWGVKHVCIRGAGC